MLTSERIKTNWLLLDDLNYWMEFDQKSINNSKTRKYFQVIDEILDLQQKHTINWLQSREAEEYFNNLANEDQEFWEFIDNEWETILNNSYSTVDELLEQIYNAGKKQGYSHIQEKIRWTKADTEAIRICKDYNFHLIRKLSNDLKHSAKTEILKGIITNENPNSLANRLVDVGVKPLDGSTLSARQRAVMIARTETSRMQNTGMLQSYINEGYTEVKILTAEDNSVCNTCLTYAYEFNESDRVIFENRKNEKVHNIIKLIKNGRFPPFHPNCRCTYLTVWESKGEPPANHYIIDLTPDDYQFENNADDDGDSEFFNKYKAPKGSKPVVISDEILEKELKGIVDSKDISSVLKLLNKFNNTSLNCDYEWIIGETEKGFSPKIAYSDWKKTKVNLQYDLRNLEDDKLLTVIHNHVWGMTPLPSDKDLKVYSNHEVKYGFITNEMGVFVIRNNNTKKLNKDKLDDLLDDLYDMDTTIIKQFKKDKNLKYDSKNSNHKYLLNEYLKDNFEYYVDKYKSLLSNYNMEVKFINAKKVNNT